MTHPVCAVSVMVSVVRSGIGVAVGRSASQSPGQPARADGRSTWANYVNGGAMCRTLTFRPGVEVWIIGSSWMLTDRRAHLSG